MEAIRDLTLEEFLNKLKTDAEFYHHVRKVWLRTNKLHLKDATIEITFDPWVKSCVIDFLKETGREVREDEAYLRSVLKEAIEWKVKKWNMDGYVLIPPEISHWEFGMALYYRIIDKP